MDFEDTPEEAAFRAGARAWLEANAIPKGSPEDFSAGHFSGEIDPAEYGLPAGQAREAPPAGYSWWVLPAGILIGVGGGLLIIRGMKRRR